MSADCVFFSKSWFEIQSEFEKHGANCFDGMSDEFFEVMNSCFERTKHVKNGVLHLSTVAEYLNEIKQDPDESDMAFIDFVSMFSVYFKGGQYRQSDLPLEYQSVYSPDSVSEIYRLLKRVEISEMVKNFELAKSLDYIPWNKLEFIEFWNDILRVFANSDSKGFAVVYTKF